MQEQSGQHGKALRWSPLPLRQLLQCTLLKLSRKPWLFQSWKQRGNEEPRFWKASQKAQNGVNRSHQSKQAKKSRHFLCLWLLYCSDWNCHLITFDHETPWSNLCLSKAAAETKECHHIIKGGLRFLFMQKLRTTILEVISSGDSSTISR